MATAQAPQPPDDRLSLLSPVWPRSTNIAVDRASGVHLHAADGRRYLDFTSGIGVTNTGHCHPRVVAAIEHQARRLIHAQIAIVHHRPVLELAAELRSVTPPGLDCCFFASSGTEAVESAMKLARHATGRTNIIAFQGGYHGRTVGAMAVTTAKTVYRDHYQPLMSGVAVAPFPYCYRYRQDPEQLTAWCLAELRHLLLTQSAPGETAAMLIEPVLGEGGYVVPPAGFLRGLRALCDEHGILLMFDEVQTGFGRTGKWFALEHFDVRPDVLIMAKGLASGMPLSCIASSRALMERWLPGSHGGTYGGNPVAAAAAVETIRVLRDEGLVERAARLGTLLIQQLSALRPRSAVLGDVRGLGLMVGCELTTPAGEPNRLAARRVRERCLAQGLLLITCGTHDHVVRWIPPLIVTESQIEEAVGIFTAALRGVERDGDAGHGS